VLWYWTTFTEQGGSPTLLLKRRAARNCYSVLSQKDLGQSTPAAGAKLVVDGRRVMTHAGRGCVGRHRGLVRATAVGAVRSNALR
jgi:nitrogenase molybdenum-iron protein alpha/beta subunit